MAKKIVVYTAIFDDKDLPPELNNFSEEIGREVDFICFTDSVNLVNDHYHIVHSARTFQDSAKNARNLKINGFSGIENYDVAIWHDSSIILNCEKIDELAEAVETSTLALFKHGETCIYREARTCIRVQKDHPIRIAIQMIYYALFLRYPVQNGMYESTLMVYRIDYFKSRLRRFWWKQVKLLSRRDQLSFPVALLRFPAQVELLEGRGFKNPYSTYRGHNHQQYRTSNPFWGFESIVLNKLATRVIFFLERWLKLIIGLSKPICQSVNF